ncbi:1515_t:CDS:1, partial [Ambispora gerdemannii]
MFIKSLRLYIHGVDEIFASHEKKSTVKDPFPPNEMPQRRNITIG